MQIDVLKTALLNARKSKNEVAKNILSYLLGQSQLKEKNPSDEQLYAIYKAYLKQMDGVDNDIVNQERVIISDLLPKQLSSDQIEQHVLQLFSDNENTRNDFGAIMNSFKILYSGQFNPGDVRAAWVKLK